MAFRTIAAALCAVMASAAYGATPLDDNFDSEAYTDAEFLLSGTNNFVGLNEVHFISGSADLPCNSGSNCLQLSGSNVMFGAGYVLSKTSYIVKAGGRVTFSFASAQAPGNSGTGYASLGFDFPDPMDFAGYLSPYDSDFALGPWGGAIGISASVPVGTDFTTYHLGFIAAKDSSFSLVIRSFFDEGDSVLVDDVKLDIESARAVPEPASWLMMIGGLAFVGAGLRRARPMRFA
jgi:hypothetical protein